ncbi:acidic proline-rich protein PRP25-like isoform X2 [Lathamus discolor]|uniref:acidic proline-rich protein PRP25-like isoform X2 n=1 Tax=Lathamus discolor TaxID=678569 RepID=UPI0032B72B95
MAPRTWQSELERSGLGPGGPDRACLGRRGRAPERGRHRPGESSGGCCSGDPAAPGAAHLHPAPPPPEGGFSPQKTPRTGTGLRSRGQRPTSPGGCPARGGEAGERAGPPAPSFPFPSLRFPLPPQVPAAPAATMRRRRSSGARAPSAGGPRSRCTAESCGACRPGGERRCWCGVRKRGVQWAAEQTRCAAATAARGRRSSASAMRGWVHHCCSYSSIGN